jgi:integrase
MTSVTQRTPERKRRGRGSNEGSIYKRTDVVHTKHGDVARERWIATVDLGMVDGKRKRQALYGTTRAEAAQKLNKVLRDRDLGVQPIASDGARTTVKAWLEQWLEDVVKRSTRPNTYLNYEQSVRVHIVPTLGAKRLGALRRRDVDAWIAERARSGLSPRTIHRLWAVLHSALEHAVRNDRLATNPASRATLPRVERDEPRTLSRDDIRQLLAALAHEDDAALYALELTTGLRQGELLGLRWAHVETETGLDLERAEVRVSEQMQHGELAPLKRGASRRVLRLRRWLVEMLHAHQDRQADAQLLAAQRWQDRGPVFPSRRGTRRSAGNMWLSWKRLLKRAGLPDFKFHELRHTAASLALSEGASLFHVSRMLGHGSISITADTYGHWTDEGREDVAARLEHALGFGAMPASVVESVATTIGYHWSPGALPEADFENEMVGSGVPGGE